MLAGLPSAGLAQAGAGQADTAGADTASDSLPAFTIPDLPPGIEIVVRESVYNPSTAAGRELIRNAPPHSGARTGPPAFTQYSIRPTWTPSAEGEICRAVRASVRVEVEVSLPLDVSVSQETWLRRHENGHLEMIVSHSIRLLDSLKALEGLTCPRLTWRAESLVRRIDRELAHAHARYDGSGQDGDLLAPGVESQDRRLERGSPTPQTARARRHEPLGADSKSGLVHELQLVDLRIP